MALSERLAFLVTVNGQDAVKGFQKVGQTAEKELGKADARLDKLAARATNVGAGMLAFSGVAAGALLGLAKASEDANRSQVELNTTLANAPKLAGETADRFNDLAESIQDKTAADGDAIVSGIAVLGNFELTAAQLEELTPLLVDYAQRTGKDIPTAAQDLGKALNGQGRALKALGIDFQDTGDRTENFNQLVDVLSDKVGGFAEREGATLSGRLERLRNELGDVAEGVGVGVVGALESALKPATAFSDWMGQASPQTQALTGNLLAVGTAGIGAVGGISLVAGQLIKLRDRFTEVDAAGGRTLNTMGKFARGAAAVTVIGGMATALYQVADAADEATANIEEAARATDRELVDAYDRVFLGVKRWHGEQKAANEQLDVFQQLARGSYGTAQRLRDALNEQGRDVSELDRILRDEAKAQRQANADAEEGVETFEDLGGAADDAAGGLERVTGQARDTRIEIEKLTEAQRDNLDATNESIDATLGYEGALNRTEDALDDYWKAGDEARKAGEDQAGVTEAIERASLDAAEAVLAQSRAAVEYVEDLKALEGKTLDAQEATRIQRDEIQKVADSLAPGNPLRQRLLGYIAELDKTDGERNAVLRAEVEEAKTKLREVDNIFKGMEERTSRFYIEPWIRPVRTDPLPEDRQPSGNSVVVNINGSGFDEGALADAVNRAIGWSLGLFGGQ